MCIVDSIVVHIDRVEVPPPPIVVVIAVDGAADVLEVIVREGHLHIQGAFLYMYAFRLNVQEAILIELHLAVLIMIRIQVQSIAIEIDELVAFGKQSIGVRAPIIIHIEAFGKVLEGVVRDYGLDVDILDLHAPRRLPSSRVEPVEGVFIEQSDIRVIAVNEVDPIPRRCELVPHNGACISPLEIN